MIGAGVGEAAPPGEAVRTFADDILFQARMRPEQPAIALSDRIATYAMFARGVTSVEARLRALRLAPDELVAVALATPSAISSSSPRCSALASRACRSSIRNGFPTCG